MTRTKFPLDPLKEDGNVFDESDDLRKNTFARLLRITNTGSASGPQDTPRLEAHRRSGSCKPLPPQAPL